ncbi:MAG TPA: C40 family peptidase [bacterium]|nr:C40 family peptidase [bacterium]
MSNEVQEYFERLAARIRSASDVDSLNRYLNLYLKESNHDRRYFHFSVQASQQEGRVQLTGEVQYPEQIEGLVSLLKTLGFETENHVAVLTEGTRQGDRYGIVKVPFAGFYVEPNPETEQVTQARYGERVQVISGPRDGHYLVRSHDAYLGWASCECFEYCPKDRWLTWDNCPRVRFGTSYDHDGVTLLANTELPLRDKDQVEFPDGALQDLSQITGSGAQVERLPFAATSAIREKIIELARTWLETKYVWGARTNQGTDCSGFAQSMYGFCGIYLPRDARHQFLVGRVCGGRDFMQALPGDLLFFLGRTGVVTHVAISLGDYRFIHAGGGRVHEASLSPNDPDYQDQRAHTFFCAKRVIPA